MDERTIRRRLRQRDFAKRTPSHYCASCTSLVYEDEPECLDCLARRPEQGWQALRDALDPFLGRIIDGRFLISRRLGRGSSGVVYRAVSYGVVREFAIKFINAGIDTRRSRHVRDRLEREIEAIGRLRNPHIVPFYEVFELYDQYLGVVMDYIAGTTLQALLVQNGHLQVTRTCQIIRQVANGLHEAHEFGLIHRDVKPDNIMVEPMPVGGDFVHILDFGVVRFAEMDQTSGGFVGTPLYASPEQVSGQVLDRRSDVYSLGAVMFHALCGRPPFIGKSMDDVLRKHTDEVPPLLSELSVELRRYTALQELVSEMLSKSRHRRPATMLEVAGRLDGIIDELEHQEWKEPSSEERERERAQARETMARTRQSLRKEVERLQGRPFSTGVVLEKPVQLLAFSHDGPLIVYDDGRIFRVNGQRLQELARTDRSPTALALVKNPLVGTREGTIIDLVTDREVFSDVRQASINAICADTFGGHVYCGLESGRVHHTVTSGENAWVWRPIMSGPPVTALACDAQARILAVAYKTREVEIWDATGSRQLISKFTVPEPVLGLTLSLDATLVAIHMRSNLVAIHHLVSGLNACMLSVPHPIAMASFRSVNGLLVYWPQDGELWAENLEQSL